MTRRRNLLFLSFFICATASAKVFEGYKKKSNSKTLEITEAVERYYEEESEFLVLIVDHSALYIFPKQAEAAEDFKNFLNESQEKKKKIKFVMDAYSREIITATSGDSEK